MLAGDHFQFQVSLGAESRAFIGSQSTTKVFRTSGKTTRQTVAARVGAGALLVFAPQPVQAFAGATYQQDHTFRLEPDSGLVVLDALSSGRRGFGESWSFRQYETRTRVFVEDKLVWHDAMRLDQASLARDRDFAVGSFHCFATLGIFGPQFSDVSRHLLEAIASRPIDPAAEILMGASAVPSGVMVRLASHHTEQAQGVVRDQLNFVAGWLGECPWNRKW